MPGIRIDSGAYEGSEVSVHYDPLIAKLIADGETRDIARRRAIEALRNYPILGIRTNISFLLDILEHPRFVSGDIDTRFLDTERDTLRGRNTSNIPPEALEIAGLLRSEDADSSRRSIGGEDRDAKADPWETLRGYRG
jgi:acetyl/propionyl-CoA carboxylase alpha subunit